VGDDHETLKKTKKQQPKNSRVMMTNSSMRRHIPFEHTDPNVCFWDGVTDVINCVIFWKMGPRVQRSWKSWKKWHFPLKSLPYNSVSNTVLHSDQPSSV